jgi:hypothetical protein
MISCAGIAFAQEGMAQDVDGKTVTISDGDKDLILRLNYDHKCVIDEVEVRGRQVVSSPGVSSGIRMDGHSYDTSSGIDSPSVGIDGKSVVVSNIRYGRPEFTVNETWRFTALTNRIMWSVRRAYSSQATLDDIAFPEWHFDKLTTWKGGILGDGGVVWCKYLDSNHATYGAHTSEVTFWNSASDDALRITPSLPDGYEGAVRFSHEGDGLDYDYTVSREDVKPKHGLARFLADRSDLWQPVNVSSFPVTVIFSLQPLDYAKAYDRGTIKGLDGDNIRELMNTVGRYGVIDSHLIGANGWRTGYMCLHEQWFGQIGLALDDPHYNSNLASDLDFERDHAIEKDGRVLARWTYGPWDAMPGTYNAQGFYEAQWGYLLDSQPDYVINVTELYDLNGNTKWLAGQKSACESALNYLIKREVGHTGLVTVLTDSRLQGRGSDWFDIVWASYENGLINAELYYALNRWADAEVALGDPVKATTYRGFAARLKTTFNLPITKGGFWDPANQYYDYWRDKDGSIHGNNLFTAINFAAISYGLCDDPLRKKVILDRIESEMQKEKLFMWPVNFTSFAPDEAASSNFPFPTYENGDIFMSWGEVGVRAYAAYEPEIALKYIKQTLARYQLDGLSFQRYLRKSQAGAGDDILAGNCMTIVGLYRDIYGIQPTSTYLYLNPHLSPELNGTRLRYLLRSKLYVIDLSTHGCGIAANGCSVHAPVPFGANYISSKMEYFPGRSKEWALSVTTPKSRTVSVEIGAWSNEVSKRCNWTESVNGTADVDQEIAGLSPGKAYKLLVNGNKSMLIRAGNAGTATFSTNSFNGLRQAFQLFPAQ